jgi:hypothetical protein
MFQRCHALLQAACIGSVVSIFDPTSKIAQILIGMNQARIQASDEQDEQQLWPDRIPALQLIVPLLTVPCRTDAVARSLPSVQLITMVFYFAERQRAFTCLGYMVSHARFDRYWT